MSTRIPYRSPGGPLEGTLPEGPPGPYSIPHLKKFQRLILPLRAQPYRDLALAEGPSRDLTFPVKSSGSGKIV